MSNSAVKKSRLCSSLMVKLCLLGIGWIGVQSIDSVQAQAQLSSQPVIVKFNTDSAYVVRENRFSKVELVYSGDTLLIDPDRTTLLRVAVHDRPPVKEEIDFEKGNITKIKIKLEKSNERQEIMENNHAVAYLSKSNVVIETDAESKVYYNRDFIGNGTQALSVGYRVSTIEVVHPEEGKETKRITVDLNKLSYFNMYQKLSKTEIQISGILPGFSQYRKEEYLKMSGILALVGISAYKVNDLWDNDRPLMRKFNQLKYVYNTTRSEEQALRTAEGLNRLQSEIADVQNEFRLWAGILITTYALNVLDAIFIEPEGGYREDQPFRINMNMVDGQPAATIGYKANF